MRSSEERQWKTVRVKTQEKGDDDDVVDDEDDGDGDDDGSED